MGLCQSQLPGKSGIVDGVSRCRTGTAVIAGYQDDLGSRLGYTGCYGSHTGFRYQFYGDSCLGVGIFQIIDQLRQILNGINVVMRGRRDQGHTGCGVSGLGDPGIYLSSGQMSALAGFCSLCHLDLNLLCTYQVTAGNTKTSTGYLLDCGTTVQSVRSDGQTIQVLTAFTGIALTVQMIHGDGHGLMSLLGYGTVGHGTGLESGHNGLYRLYFLNRHTLFRIIEVHQSSEILDGIFVVYHGSVLLEHLVITASGGFL